MGLVDDFLANNTPTIPPTQQQEQQQEQPLEPVDLSNIAPQAKNPELAHEWKHYQGVKTDTENQTTDAQTTDLKELRPNGLKPNVYDNSVQQRTKQGGVKTETTERLRERTPYAEFERTTPAGKVLEQLRLNPPKPTQDSERMRKMAGIQAISEALRNVVDGVYGRQKAVIVPHKTYTNEFLKEAKNADAVQAKALEKWIKSMNDASKNAMEGYLRYLAQEDKTNIKKIVNTTPEVTTTTEVSEGKRVFAPKSGGGGSGAGGGAGAKVKEITSSDTGESWILDDAKANSAFSYITDQKHSGIAMSQIPREYQDLIRNVKMGVIKPTAENLHAFVQWAFDAFPEAGKRFAVAIGATNTQGEVSQDARGQASKTGYKVINKNKKPNTQATTTKPKETGVKGATFRNK